MPFCRVWNNHIYYSPRKFAICSAFNVWFTYMCAFLTSFSLTSNSNKYHQKTSFNECWKINISKAFHCAFFFFLFSHIHFIFCRSIQFRVCLCLRSQKCKIQTFTICGSLVWRQTTLVKWNKKMIIKAMSIVCCAGKSDEKYGKFAWITLFCATFSLFFMHMMNRNTLSQKSVSYGKWLFEISKYHDKKNCILHIAWKCIIQSQNGSEKYDVTHNHMNDK